MACTAACGGSADTDPLAPPTGLAACGPAPMLTALPIALADIGTVAPLGTLNPPGHIFPSDHPGYYLKSAGGVPVVTAVRSPGEIVIVQIARQTSAGLTDYRIEFYPCSNLHLWIGHLTALAPELLAAAGSLEGHCTDLIGPSPIRECSKDVRIEWHASAALGSAGGAGEPGMDFGAMDDRTAPLAYINQDWVRSRYGKAGVLHTVCPFDYIVSPLRESMDSLWGEPGQRRTAEPLCGQVMQDVAGTAQGRWFYAPAIDSPVEAAHLALVHRNTDPAVGAFSVGTSIPALPVNVYYFPAAATGRINLDFNRVTADGLVYCYAPTMPAGRLILIQLPSTSQLRIDARAGTACGDPSTWVLSAGAVTFSR